jgi:hypothetical protein
MCKVSAKSTIVRAGVVFSTVVGSGFPPADLLPAAVALGNSVS